MAQYSVAFLSFLMVFLANSVRYSLREGVFRLPLARRFCQKSEPGPFYLWVCVTSVLSLICFLTISGYVVKVATTS